jgi:hypothetical protein
MAAPMGAPMAGTASSTQTMAGTADEITGASRIQWGALLGLLGLALAIAGGLLIVFEVGFAVAGATGSSLTGILSTFLIALLLVVVGVFLALLSFVLYTAGFASLRRADGRFNVAMVLCVIGLVGLLCIGLFATFYAVGVNTAIGCATSDTTCLNNATTLPSFAGPLLYLGGLLAFIGLIGTIIGLWRFGSKYSSGVTKAGAILYIIPVVAILAPVLVLIGAHQVHKRLQQPAVMAPPAMPPMSPMAPPPPPAM